MERAAKEPKKLQFCGDKYKFTYNGESDYIHSRLSLIFI